MSIIERALDKSAQAAEEAVPQPAVTDPEVDAGIDGGLAELETHIPAEPPDMEASPEVSEEPDKDARPTATGGEITLNFDRIGANGIITPNRTNTSTVEQFRIVKQPLLIKAFNKGPERARNSNLIMVTSSLPGEGKTFTSICLAMSIAMELDRTVLLVDADIVRSDISRILGIEPVDGLADYLASDNLPLSKLLLKTNVPKLTVLPAGHYRENVTELLASEDMVRLAEELSQRYHDRVIVFDSPPILSASGSSVLARLMGQIVMVVEAVRTSQSAVREALKRLDSTENVGMLLNKSRQRPGPGYRYGYYYYGSG